MSQKIKTSVEIDGSLSASQIQNATVDTDKFLVSDGGTVKYRTGAEMLSDLGVVAGTANHVQHPVKAGVAINKGQAVYVTGADGTNMIVGLASNATEATSSKTMGLLNATVNINDFADVITEGLLAGLNTSAATVGDPIWLGTGGNLIYGLANKPYAPNHLVFIGIVTRVNANNGEIFVKVQNGFELNEIHDVDLKTTVPVGNDILAFEGAPVNLWKNKTIASVLGYTPYNASNPNGYISSYTETDPIYTASSWYSTVNNASNWDTAYGWGNHASAGYAASGHTHDLGRYSLRAPALIDSVTASNFRTQLFGSSTSGYNISTARFNTTPGLLSGLNNYGTMMAWSGSDTHGFLAVDYAGAAAIVGGGNADNINWTKRLAFLDDTVPNSRTITINGTSYDLSANRSWTVTASETDTLQTVTNRGNVTTTSITANSVIIPSFETATNVLSFRSGIPDGTNVGIRAKAIATANRDGLELLGYNGIDFSIANGATVAARVVGNGNFLIGPTTDAGYKLDVNGTGRFSGTLRISATTPTQEFFSTGNGDVWGSIKAEASVGTGGQLAFSTKRNGNTETVKIRVTESGNTVFYPNLPVVISGQGAAYYGSNITLASDTGSTQGANRIWSRYDGTGRAALTFETATNTQSYNSDPTSLTYTEYMRITGLGDVGINTGSPSAKLHVGGSFITDLDSTYHMGIKNEYVSTYISKTKFGRWNSDSNLEIYYDIAGTEEARIKRNYPVASLKFDRQATTDMMIAGNGNVLIGTTTDAGYKLDVNGTLRSQGALTVNNNAIFGGSEGAQKRLVSIGLNGADYQHRYILLAKVPTFGASTVNAGFRGSIMMERVNGIGIDVHDEFDFTVSYGNSIQFVQTSYQAYQTSLVQLSYGGTQYLALYVYSAPGYSIAYMDVVQTNYGGWLDGNTFVAVESSSSLHSSVSYSSNGTIIKQPTNIDGTLTVTPKASAVGMFVNHGGSVTNPAAKFNSAGGGTTYGANTVTIDGCNYGSGLKIVTNLWSASQQAVQFTGPTTTVGSITCTTSATSYNTSSDYRLKENVAPIEFSINRLKELNPCRFNFINDPDKTVDGFIAHEVQEVIPEAITGIKDELDYDGAPKYQGIDQSKIVPLLTAALQEAIEKIELLEQRINIIENK